MSLFDSIISTAAEKFGLGDKAGTLLSALLSQITNQETGGFAGFLGLFSKAGLDDVASSWISSGANASLSNEQLESALGESAIGEIAEQVGVDQSTATSALAFMVPQVVDKLTPDGVIPEEKDLLSKIGDFLSGWGGTIAGVAAGAAGMAGAVAGGAVDKVGDAAGATVDAGKKVVGAVGDTVGDAAGATVDAGKKVVGAVGDTVGGAFNKVGGALDDVSDGGGSILKWLLPLIILGLLLLLGAWFCSKPTVAPTNPNANANKGGNTATAAKAESSLKIEAKDGKYFITGTVADEKTKKEIEDKFKAELGADKCDFSGLKIDANAKPADWLGKVYEFLPNLKAGDWKAGSLNFSANKLEAVGDLPKGIADKIKSIFTGWTLLPAITFAANEAEAAKTANEEAAKKLESAKTPQEIVDALNLSIIQFETGKATINPASMEIVKKAAEVLKTVAEGTVIEVGGHTDNVGDKAKNQKLSEDRANAVKSELEKLGVKTGVLTGKGYGDSKPKADNSTANGKAQNRRIEYTLGGGTPVTGTTASKPAEGNSNANANTAK